MSVEEMNQKAMKYIAESSMKPIGYQWKIKHHQQMHEAYERSLQNNG